MDATLLCLYAAGAAQLLWALLHLAMPRLLKGSSGELDASGLGANLIQALSLLMAFYLAATGYFALMYAEDMLASRLGAKLLGMMTAYWVLRLGLQLRFFKPIGLMPILLNLAAIATLLLTAYPLLHGARP